MPTATGSTFSHQIVRLATFTVGGLFFGVDVTCVQEVLRFQPMTKVPQAPGVVEGLINLRGQIVIAIDMRYRMNLPPRSEGEMPMNVVVRSSEGPVSFLVDDIGDVMEIETASVEYPPENLDKSAQQVIKGVCKLPNRLLLILDEEQTADITTVI